MNPAVLGGIVKHTGGGVGFKVTFPTDEEAQKYKEHLKWMLLNDGYKVEITRAYYDLKEDKKGGK